MRYNNVAASEVNTSSFVAAKKWINFVEEFASREREDSPMAQSREFKV